ncbi:hypothetical protein [Sporosarcina ureilytica]|uniref:Uncharacterized protein n=1 Tax=Sporosarcina ureilytica TaxID=298596 RepID=A0A1D8JEF9_9BACL|nr:hypothetical protein [Sporosarcina ureilytica]AOV07063.1 hypothetical protein BI350_05555 [Sporosarcina ureilytica]
MFTYLSSVSLLLVIIPFFSFESPYMVLPLVFATLGAIFGVISIKKESGFLGKITFIINPLLLLAGILILLFSLLWIISGTPKKLATNSR